MATEPEPLQCSNPDCKVGQTGKCVEGLELNKCPHYGKPLQPIPSASSTAEEARGLLLPSGDLLTNEGASQVLRRGRSRVIAIVGPKEAGKTTLIASIFELFLRGAIGPYRFSNSKTLYAFERSCHPSRAISQNVVPKTERTILTDVHFYHLAMRENDAPVVDMLLADRSGEDYRASTDNPSTASAFAEITRADTVTFLVDGHQLLGLTTRNSIASEIVGIAQALIDGDGIKGRPRAAVVLTKVDEIARSADHDRTMRDFHAVTLRFEKLFGETFREIKHFKIAACPSDTTLPLGHGVLALLSYWYDEPSDPVAPASPYISHSTRFMQLLRGTQE